MNDERFDELIDSTRHTYRVPAEPPVDEMWAAIEAELGSPGTHAESTDAVLPGRFRGAQWRLAGAVAVAALVVGVGLGRWTANASALVGGRAAAGHAVAAANQASLLSEPLQSTTSDYLGETATMLRQFENSSRTSYAGQASSLLATTRLLLDSPAATDPHMHELLEDLELILAQIAALRNEGSSSAQLQELQVIRSALRERDVVPRVHTAAVTLASSSDE